MKKVLIFLVFAIGSLTLTSTQAGTFYYGDPSGKGPIAPPSSIGGGVAACASEYFDYDFVDIQYRYLDYDDKFFDQSNGVSLGFSKTLTECTFVTLGGQWDQVNGASPEDDVDLWSFSGGVGMIFPLAERLHLVAEGGAFYDFEDSGNNDNFGGFVGPTLRIGVTKALEAFTSATYFFDGDNDQFEYTVGGVLRITQALGIKANWSFNDDEQTVGVGVRIAF